VSGLDSIGTTIVSLFAVDALRGGAHASFADVPPSDLKITSELHLLVSFSDFPCDPDLAVVDRPFNRSGAMAALNRACWCPR
jgi:hypothetical protein